MFSVFKKINSTWQSFSLTACMLIAFPPLFWSGNFIVGRLVRNDIPPVTLTFTRWLIAACCILPFAWKYMKKDVPRYRAFIPRIIAVSVSGIVAFSLLVYVGLHYTSSTNALLLNSCIPVLIMLFAAIFYGQRLLIKQMIGVIISFVGVLTLIFQGSITGMMSLTFSFGDILLFAAMACFALYTLWLKKIPEDINRLGLLGVQVIVTLVIVFPLLMWELSTDVSIHWNKTSLLAVAFLGIFPSFFSYLLFARCISHFGATRAGLSIHLIPVFGVFLSVLFLGEHIHFYHVLGIVTIIIGITVASTRLHNNVKKS